MQLFVVLAVVVTAQVHLEARRYPSKVFGGERRVLVYLPPASSRTTPGALLICFGGVD